MKDKNKAYIDILNNAIDEYPIVKMGETLGTLLSAKREMDEIKKDGYDNYAHRLAMCLNGQRGVDGAAYSLGWGILKELYDITKKTPKKGLKNALKDSFKDMKNNIEGLEYGLTNPEKSCRTWLKDLDYGANEWKR